MTDLKKNDYFIDISSYQNANAVLYASASDKTIIKLTEGIGYYNYSAVSQTNTSNCVGYYHFARFGDSVAQAQAEARYFLSTVPKRVKYLVCDYEDSASSNVQANTNAVLAFMDTIKAAGYIPIYYSYKPFTLANVYYKQILAKYPDSLWIAAYPNYNYTPDPVWSIFPSMDGIRWWQFTSTGLPGGLDKNIVLINDETAPQSTSTINKQYEKLKGKDMFLIKLNGYVKLGDDEYGAGAIFTVNTATGVMKHISSEEYKLFTPYFKMLTTITTNAVGVTRAVHTFKIKTIEPADNY
ncbi:GH25 family lysozyme [Streptococcus caviae]|uniref:GH25 family lysozyme n=1 Tax=Streptococcus sp. 'caviae' TaxID=1915004 RepID=UPI0009FA086C|nr:GH25 family lysozyme [Streptococcus sp. 'caviae']